MPTNAEIAAQLLRQAGSFFRTIGEQNADLNEQMQENARIYDLVADRVEAQPQGDASAPVEQ